MTRLAPVQRLALLAALSAATACGGLTDGEGDTAAPQVLITEPQASAIVAHLVTIRAIATDDVAVVSVKFYVDGTALSEDAIPPYQTVWSAAGATNGTQHVIRAEARDAAGKTAIHEITVTVDNSRT